SRAAVLAPASFEEGRQPRSSKFSELVSDPPNRMNVFRVLGISLNFRAQPVDVRIDRVIVTAVLIAPHLIEELVAAVYPSWVSCKVNQQIEFARSQFDRSAAHDDAMALDVDSEILRLDDFGFGAVAFLAQHLDAPE